MTISKTYIKYFVFSLIIISFIISYFIWAKNVQDLKTNHILATSTIVSWSNDSKSGVWLDYQFKVDNKTYNSSTKFFNLSSMDALNLVGKTFPVVYSPSNPKNNELLIRPQDFTEFSIIQPDSLFKYNSLFD
jgi:hypothetical protein